MLSNVKISYSRILSAIIICFFFMVGVFGPNYFFNLIMTLTAIGMLSEWYKITSKNTFHLFLGLVLISISISSLLVLKKFTSSLLLFWFFSSIWIMDTFAMIFGKAIGGLKLAPSISPNKTWSGFIGGILVTLLSVSIFDIFYPLRHNFPGMLSRVNIVFTTLIITVLAHLGDLSESYFKRLYGFKDSSNFIPGHGGVLDRFDSILFTAPFILLCSIV